MDTKIIAAVVAVVVVVGVGVGIALTMNNGGNDSGSSDGQRVGETLKEADFPNSASRLWVYGNANEDDKLDQSDVTALEKMVSGEQKATQLADTNADGKVDSKDVDYLKNILNANKDTKIKVYYVDNYFRVAKVSWPVKSFGTTYCSGLYTAETTGLMDKLAMVDSTIQTYWAKLNSHAESAVLLGTTEEPNYEKIIETGISVYVPGYCDGNADKLSQEKLNPVGIDVMFLNTCDNSGVDITNEYIDRSIVMFGYLLQGDMTQTYKYLNWHDEVIKKVKDAAATIAENDKGPIIMSRSAPSYDKDGQYSLTGKGNTNMIHADWAGCYVVADHTDQLPKNYNNKTAQDIGTILKSVKDSGKTTLYWIDNEHDGLRHQYNLDDTVKSWYDTLSPFGDEIPTINYMGMAREAGNSPLYIVEMVFYLNVMHPGLLNLDFEDVFNYWINNFTQEKSKYTSQVNIDDFFINYGTNPAALTA